MKILLIDNYDSFTYNLYHYLSSLKCKVDVYRNDKIEINKIRKNKYKKIIISPGPGNPNQAGNCLKIVKYFYKKIPILGVCLGHQIIRQVFKCKIVGAKKLMHGKTSLIKHNGKGVFKDIKTAQTSAKQFVDLMGEDVQEALNFRKRMETRTDVDDILKEINWLGEAKEFGKRDLNKINRYTDMNQHNDSVKHLAQAMGLKKEEKIMDNITQIHKLEKSMSPNLISYRTEIMNRLLKVADKMYSNASDIHKAF